MSQLFTYLGYPFVAGTLVDTDWHDCNSRILLDDIFPPLFTLVVIELFKFFYSASSDRSDLIAASLSLFLGTLMNSCLLQQLRQPIHTLPLAI
jgi:hypothetical protein